MGFIINSDDYSFDLTLLYWGKHNERLTFLRLLLIDLGHPTAKQQINKALRLNPRM